MDDLWAWLVVVWRVVAGLMDSPVVWGWAGIAAAAVVVVSALRWISNREGKRSEDGTA